MEPKIEFTKDNEPIHFSVGAVIKNNKGQYLLIDRLKEPFGFACPAGHIDEGEYSYTAVSREVEEETGLSVISIKNIDIGDYSDAPNEPCSRGVKIHKWELFEVEVEGRLICKKDEVKSIGWYSVEAIKELPLELIWKYWLTKLNII